MPGCKHPLKTAPGYPTEGGCDFFEFLCSRMLWLTGQIPCQNRLLMEVAHLHRNRIEEFPNAASAVKSDCLDMKSFCFDTLFELSIGFDGFIANKPVGYNRSASDIFSNQYAKPFPPFPKVGGIDDKNDIPGGRRNKFRLKGMDSFLNPLPGMPIGFGQITQGSSVKKILREKEMLQSFGTSGRRETMTTVLAKIALNSPTLPVLFYRLGTATRTPFLRPICKLSLFKPHITEDIPGF